MPRRRRILDPHRLRPADRLRRRVACGALPELLRTLGARRVLLVTTEGRLGSDDGDAVVRARSAGRWRRPSPRSVARAGAARAAGGAARPGATASTASCRFGGGSLRRPRPRRCASSPSRRRAPRRRRAPTDRRCPHVSIPTTYSGAELTPFFGMTDPATRQKSGAGGPTVAPIAAVYDPELTLSTPAAGQRRDRHERAGPLRRGGLVAAPHARGRGRRARRRRAHRRRAAAAWSTTRTTSPPAPTMLEGAVLGGRCLQNASMGVHHGLSQLVGGRTGIAHGLANAVILPHADAASTPTPCPTRSRRIGARHRRARRPGRRGRRRWSTGSACRPGSSDCGVTDDDLDAVARLAAGNRNVAANPRPVSEDDARAILEAAVLSRGEPYDPPMLGDHRRLGDAYVRRARSCSGCSCRCAACDPAEPEPDGPRWSTSNQVQVIGSHNSYHVLATRRSATLRRSVHRRRGGRPRVRPRPARRCSSPRRRCARSSSTSSPIPTGGLYADPLLRRRDRRRPATTRR